MIRMTQVKLPVTANRPYDPRRPDISGIKKKCAHLLKIRPEQIRSVTLQRRALDARKKPQLFDVCTVLLTLTLPENTLSAKTLSSAHAECIGSPVAFLPKTLNAPRSKDAMRPVIIGAGPAGLFCAYGLLCAGFYPILLERGGPVEERKEDVERFFSTGILAPDSNVQFGEGGAGAFSDGKLNTGSHDRDGVQTFVLETLIRFGAPEHIRYDAAPHLGTDRLFFILKEMRRQMQDLGCEYVFHTRATGLDIEQGRIRGVFAEQKKDGTVRPVTFRADIVVLAIGHSARDLFAQLYRQQVPMEAKPFAVGFRVEHPQSMINEAMVGKDAPVAAASNYKLTYQAGNGHSVYSFCMCPGGYVVSSASADGETVVNGMSYAARNGHNANSAIVMSVPTSMIGSENPMDAIRFQQDLEHRAYALCNGAVPQQLYGDFCEGRESTAYGTYPSAILGTHAFANLRGLLPEKLEEAFFEAMPVFGKRIPGFDRKDSILSGVESRTSSPVRILRDADGQSEIKGLFPAGEGAGYAGGILSAASDGLRTADKITTYLLNQR